MRDRLAATFAACRHAGAPDSIAADAAGNCSAILLQPSVNQRNVCFLDPPTGELRRQFAMSYVVLCDYDQPARSLIQAMHYSRPRFTAYSGELPKAIQERID